MGKALPAAAVQELSAVVAKPKELDRKTKYLNNDKIILGYWKIRGLAQPIRYLLEYIEHPYEDVLYE